MKNKSRYQKVVETVNEITIIGEKKRLGRFYTEDKQLDGRIITAYGNPMVNFGSCGYLGLEMDKRLKDAAIEAIDQYGTLFASSRLYTSTGNYLELEELLSKLFDAHIVLTSNVSLGHHSVMPIVIGSDDLVIYDQQAHISMHELAYKLRHMGTAIDILRHNRLDELEKKLEESKEKYEKIWYVIDGVYSMFGDPAPFQKINDLLNKHKKLHLYADDAHGMSWAGPNGAGYAMSQIKLHPKMVMATSIAKGFGSCGGVFLFKDITLRDKVRRWGGPLTYSGPQEPATVSAAIASAKIHLSDEIYELQQNLADKINYCNEIMTELSIPLVSISGSPIFYVGLGITKMGYNMIDKLIRDGLYTNMGVFPAVPETCTGIRFTITNHIQKDDITKLAERIKYHLPTALREEDRSINDVLRAFRKFSDMESRIRHDEYSVSENELVNEKVIETITNRSVSELNRDEWNDRFGDRGGFDYDSLLLLEKSFSENEQPENNWEFYYYTVKDRKNRIILQTFFTCVLNKDDIVAEAEVSALIEKQRIEEPYFLTSRYFMMGSLLTNGNHLFLDKNHSEWQRALIKLFDAIWLDQDATKSNVLYLRDFENTDEELLNTFRDYGFIKIELQDNNIFPLNNYENIDGYINCLPHKKRQHLKRDVLKTEGQFDITFNEVKKNELAELYQLYLNVQKSNMQLNTFQLPLEFFENILSDSNWEIVRFSIRDSKKVVAVVFSSSVLDIYNPTIVGLDYSVSKNLNLYKQILYQMIKRGFDIAAKKINFGITSAESKRKLGIHNIPQLGFVQVKDPFNMDYIESLKFN